MLQPHLVFVSPVAGNCCGGGPLHFCLLAYPLHVVGACQKMKSPNKYLVYKTGRHCCVLTGAGYCFLIAHVRLQSMKPTGLTQPSVLGAAVALACIVCTSAAEEAAPALGTVIGIDLGTTCVLTPKPLA